MILETVEPTEVALRKWWGDFEERILTSSNGLRGLGTGLHFAIPAIGIKLVRFSNQMFNLRFQVVMDKKKGTMLEAGHAIEVRTKDNQKMFVDVAVYLRFPTNHTDSLMRIYQSQVPLTNENGELADYIYNAIDATVIDEYSRWTHTDVMGGKHSVILSENINQLLRKDKKDAAGNIIEHSLFWRLGLLGQNPNRNEPGEGELNIKIQFGHLSPDLSRSVEGVAIATNDAEAAKKTAEKNAEIIGGTVRKSMDKVKDLDEAARTKAHELMGVQIAAEKGELNFNRDEVLVGNIDGTKMEPVDGFLLSIIKMLRGGDRAQGQQPPPPPQPQKGGGQQGQKGQGKPGGGTTRVNGVDVPF